MTHVLSPPSLRERHTQHTAGDRCEVAAQSHFYNWTEWRSAPGGLQAALPEHKEAKSRDGLPFGPCATCARCRRNASHLRNLRETAVQAQVRRSARLQNGACRLALFGSPARPDTLCLSIQRPACNTGRVSGLGLPSAVGRGIIICVVFSVDYLANFDRSTAATTRNKSSVSQDGEQHSLRWQHLGLSKCLD